MKAVIMACKSGLSRPYRAWIVGGTSAHEAQYAAGEIKVPGRKPKPPLEIGRDAMARAQSMV